jgi:uncharacterized protein YkwD
MRLGTAGVFASAALLSTVALADAPAVTWKTSTESPRAVAKTPSKDAKIYAACGAMDSALADVATHRAATQATGTAQPASEELVFALRAFGDPHVWPRAWNISGSALDPDDVEKRVTAWASSASSLGTKRCGVGRAHGADGTDLIAVVSVDALADLAPLPTTARLGQWLSLEGTMLVPASDVKVILLGPRGAPKTVIASLNKGKIKSTFSADQNGEWLVQVLATVATGPRPVLEALVYVGTTPPTKFTPTTAPGESAGKGVKDDADAILKMLNAARALDLLAPLSRDASLDALAKAHTEQMMKARMVGHDVGDGDPVARMKAAGVVAHTAGENVASAGSPEAAHRALWASPSHRGNMLLDRWTKVGISAIRAADGQVWVTQLFAG